MKIWIFIFICSFSLCNISGENEVKSFEDIISQCCTEGENFADEGGLCSNIKPKLDQIPALLISSCFFSSEICCASKLRIEQCKAGVEAAKEGMDCHKNATDYYTGCCEACKIGLVVGETVSECTMDTFGFGIPFDDSFKYCCTEMKTVGVGEFYLNEGEEKDLCNKFDNLCSQICENTDDSYVCKCKPGYKLLENKITCAKVEDDDSNNEVIDNSNNETDECENGYTKNLAGDECEDIDECESGEAICDADTQVCYNYPGTYTCLDIIQSPSKCSEGYRYNAKLDRCDDINECLEQLHNCTKNTQVCLNSRGGYACQNKASEECLPGFEYDKITEKCQDIDECVKKQPCDSAMECINTDGGFTCRVKPTPKRNQNVNPLVTSKKLSCAAGFRPHFNKCIDIDECATDKNACDTSQNCINLPGGFQCDCKEGFSLDKVTNACVDVNECQINNHNCLETQRCDNTIGSYTCIRLQSCGTGYTLNAETGYCDDDDECALNRHNCHPPYECRNTKGSFRCDRIRVVPTTTTTTTTTTTQRPTTSVYTPTVRPYIQTPPTNYNYNLQPIYHYSPKPPVTQTSSTSSSYSGNYEYDRYLGPCNVGFERNSQGACADIDECYVSNPCRRNQRCINSNGSYKCQNLLTCSGGYTSNDEGTQCIDIDECETKEASCGHDQICRNKPGGYTCSCPPGHILNSNRVCEDVNECEFYKGQVCPVNTICLNTIGSHRCECKEGFKKRNEDDKVCNDIDECQEIPGLCQQRCNNFWGSYRCSCESGYRLSENNRTCEDVDECEVHKLYNLCVGICENTQGSYRCRCPDGYKLGADGRICQDIDECTSQRACNGRNEICTNIRGSYRCTAIQCPSDFIIDPEKRNRCKRTSLLCEHGDIECFQRPSSITYNFITFVSNAAIPPDGRSLFTLKGPSWYENIDFDLKIINTSSRRQNVNERFFRLHKNNNEVLLSLMESLEGPQDIELELKMSVFRGGQPAGTNIAKIFIIVSEFIY